MTLVGIVRLSRMAPLGWPAGLIGLALLCLVQPAASAQPATSDEYKVKAAFLFNFAQFVEWPAQAFRPADAPLVIGILGDDPFGPYLDELVRGEKVGKRPLL
ncbi:MAG: YfiR family protein, partial [Opitutaceae bacterium]